MSINNIKQEKDNKIFKKCDILLYGLIILVVVVLFVVTFFVNKKVGLEGIEIYINDNMVCSYNFEENSFDFDMPSTRYNLKEVSHGYELTIYSDDNHNEYNVIFINKDGKEISISDANCSNSKDCKYMKIDDASDVIVCVPHKLIIKGIGEQTLRDPVSG